MEDFKQNIQRASLDNLKDLEHIAKICDAHKTPHKMVWSLDLLKAFYSDPNSTIFVYHKGKVVGGIIARYNNDYSKLHIYNIFVSPNYQNCGIGKSLIEQLCKDAKTHGTEYICTLNNSISKYFEKQNFVKGKIYLWHKLDPFNCQRDINIV